LRGDPEKDLDEGIPASLRSYTDYRAFGILPFAGGLFDQDPLMLRDFREIATEVAQFHERNRGG
jgi:hypothetical protein